MSRKSTCLLQSRAAAEYGANTEDGGITSETEKPLQNILSQTRSEIESARNRGPMHKITMKYKGYRGCAVFDEEANIFHGEVMGLRDVATFSAKTADELSTAFIESVEDYLDFRTKERTKTVAHETFWYLSYANENGFQGACYVRGTDIKEAAQEAIRVGARPLDGGQVLGFEVPDDIAAKLPADSIDRLLTAAEVYALADVLNANR